MKKFLRVCVFECLVSCFRYYIIWLVFIYNYIKLFGKFFIVFVYCICKYMYRKYLFYKGVVLINIFIVVLFILISLDFFFNV